MLRPLTIAAVVLASATGIIAASPARAQGAFNMGSLTQTLSQDAGTQSEERRAYKSRGARSRAGSRLKALCAQRFQYSAAERASADGRDVERTCRREGY